MLDYDDLLLYWAEMLADPAAAAELGAAFDHVLVDEYQDTNRLQAEILRALKPDGRGVTVVGDDAQAIYGFRAAEVRNILDFPGRFDPPARDRHARAQLPLDRADPRGGERGHRRGRASASPRTLWTDRRSEARPLPRHRRSTRPRRPTTSAPRCSRRARRASPLKAQAVLFRTAHHSGPLEIELVRRNIPFVKFGGLKFLEAAHVKDLLAVLRFAENPRDRLAGFRVLQLLPGIGPAAAEEMLRGRRGRRRPRRRSPPSACRSAPPGTGRRFAALFALLRRGDAGWPAEIEAARLWYEPHLERLHEDAARAPGRPRPALPDRARLPVAREPS